MSVTNTTQGYRTLAPHLMLPPTDHSIKTQANPRARFVESVISPTIILVIPTANVRQNIIWIVWINKDTNVAVECSDTSTAIKPQIRAESIMRKLLKYLTTSPKNVRERPKQSMDMVDATMPPNITGFRPIRSESRLKGNVVRVFAM